jgi:hypothetical protein
MNLMTKATRMADIAFKFLGLAAVALAWIPQLRLGLKSEEAFARLNTALKNTKNGSVSTEESLRSLAEANTKLGFSTESTTDALGTLSPPPGNVKDSTHLLSVADGLGSI